MPDKQTTRCERCGHHQKHNRQICPAKDARCHKCSKQSHFAKCCRAKSRVNVVSEVELAETSSSDSEVFLGEVSANEHKPWTADIIVNQDCVTFKLDSGADVTVLPASTYNKLLEVAFPSIPSRSRGPNLSFSRFYYLVLPQINSTHYQNASFSKKKVIFQKDSFHKIQLNSHSN